MVDLCREKSLAVDSTCQVHPPHHVDTDLEDPVRDHGSVRGYKAHNDLRAVHIYRRCRDLLE